MERSTWSLRPCRRTRRTPGRNKLRRRTNRTSSTTPSCSSSALTRPPRNEQRYGPFIPQTISVYFLFSTHAFISGRRSPSPDIHSYTKPEGVDSFATDSIATKSGATVTYGPFSNIPESISPEFIKANQKPLTVHYRYDFPVLEIKKLERLAEISHWGANLNIHNNIDLHNAGPKYVLSRRCLPHCSARLWFSHI